MMIWGHRGHRHHRVPERYFQPAYENSLQAYADALSVCAGLECDVVQSSDGTGYLIHDTLFEGIVRYELKTHLDEKSKQIVGNQFIYQMSDKQIADIRLKDGQPLPRLRQLFELMKKYPNRVLNLELKGPHTADMTVRAVERAIQEGFFTPDNIVFSSFNFPALRHLRQQVGTRFKIGALFEPSDNENWNRMYPSWPNAEQDAYYVPISEKNLQRPDLIDIQPDFFNLERSSVTTRNVDAIDRHFPKAKLIVWPAGEQHPDMDQTTLMLAEAVSVTGKLYAVTTDFPEVVQQRLLARGLPLQLPE